MPSDNDEIAATVAVIDDDLDVREALGGLFRSVGLSVQLYGSVAAYREAASQNRAGCLVLDVRLPGTSGLDFQTELQEAGSYLPIVFISGHADIAMSVRAMKSGAVEFLTKPVRDQDLLDAVQLALSRDRERRAGTREADKVAANYAKLTLREREVLAHVIAGSRNKRIAAELGITEATVKLHRSHIMQKMRAQTLVDLVRITDLLSGRTILDERLGLPRE